MSSFKLLITLSVLVLFIQAISSPQQGTNLSANNILVAFPFFDDVENSETSSAYWQRDTTVWKIRVANAHSGSQVWAMLPTTGSYNYLTLATSIDLASAANPYFSVWTRKSDGGSGLISIEVSTNSGSSWTPISQPSYSGGLYVRHQASLNNFRLSNVLVRIGGYAPWGGTYFFDDILIDNAPAPRTITLTNPADNGMRVQWTQSTASDFFKYRIILSTDANAVNNYFVAPSVSGRTETRVFDIFTKTKLDSVLTDLTFANTVYYAKVYEQDTQDFINQGSERTDLTTTFNITPQIAPFVQTFEGSYNWVADLPWAVTEDDSSDPGHSPTRAYEDSPQGSYPANADRRLTMQVNLAGVTRPVLRFNHKYSFEAGADHGSVEISSDNATWTTLTGFTGNIGGEWESRHFDIGVLKQQTTGFVRFRTTSNSANNQDGWHLDDVEVYNNTRTRAFPFFDNVEVDTFSQNSWIAGSFELKLANAYSGDQVWSLRPSGGAYNYLTLSGRMNLSGTPNPYLSFWIKKADGGSGLISIEASNDAGLTWTVLAQPSFSGTQYVWHQASLANFRQANVLIRIGCYSPWGGTYYIDDILIDNAPTPRTLTLLTPTNNGMRVRWGASTATDFGNYRIVLSTDANTVNNYFASPSLSSRTETRVFDVFNKATVETTLTDLTFTNMLYYAKIYERDTQLLINQGSDRADLSTAFTVITQVAPFLQTFEGSFGWAADIPWAVTQDDSSEPGHSGTHAFEDSPGTNYPANADRRLVVQMNTLATLRPVLRFNHKYSFEQGSDFGVIEYSSDNANWTTITGFTGSTNTGWEQREFDAGTLKQQTTVYVRFRTTSNSANHQDGWHLDDVEVYNNTRVFTVPIIDSAEVDSISKKYWIAGQWNIKSANAHSGSQVWSLAPAGGNYNYLTLAGTVNLSAAPKPFLSIWIKKADGGGGLISIEASNNSGLTWTAISQPNFSGSNYTNYIVSLNNYRQPNVLLRIGAYSPWGGTYLLDDITLADSTGWVRVDDFAGTIPDGFNLYQNYPNPFNPVTTIQYDLPATSQVRITVSNILGQQVAVLVDEIQEAGYKSVQWNASTLPSGIYFYRIQARQIDGGQAGNFNQTKKLLLLK